MIWSIFYWVLLVLAMSVGLRGLFWDRAGFRGRAGLRCKKCWYDLSASKADLRVDGIVCPECGKKHTSQRSMRKTRWSKRWIAAALILWGMSYGARVTPQVQKFGWNSAVPRIVFVASLPFLSEEQGSGLSKWVLVTPATPENFGAQGYDKWVLDQVGEGWFFQHGQRDSGYGWITRHLLFALARLESESKITDGTSAKGRAYKSIISKVVYAGEAYSFEERWARGVATVDCVAEDTFAPGAMVYGRVRVRRLLLGAYEMSGGQSSTMYRCSTPTSLWGNGFVPNRTPEVIRSYWIDRFLWDSMTTKDSAYDSSSDEKLFPIGVDDGSGTIDLQMILYDPEMKSSRHATVTTQVPYVVDDSFIIVPESTLVLRDWIESHLLAKLTVRHDYKRDAWVPVVELRLYNPRSTDPEETILFGGRISVEVVWSLSGTEYAETMFRSSTDTWWRWSVEPGEKDTNGMSLNQDENSRVRPERVLRARSMDLRFLPSEVQSNHNLPADYKNSSFRAVVRIKPIPGQTLDFAGMWGDRFYDGELELPLYYWSLDDFRRFVVNGVLPDHAMP